jgi:uncharacterized protein (TIGR03663 family)
VLYIGVMLFVIVTRLWALSSRAYCHDESIHAWESWKLATGQGYTHNPIYHGPFLYHITALLFALFGDNDFTGRLATSVMGILIAGMPFLLRKQLGTKGALLASFLIAISPVMMHRSRFIRHDHAAILFNVLLLVAAMRYLDDRKPKHLYWIAAALSLGLAAKETTFITYFIFGTFFAAQLAWEWLRDRSRPITQLPVFDVVLVMGTFILPTATAFPVQLLGGNPIDYTQSGILMSGAVFLVLVGIGVAIGALWNWRRWLICAAIFYGIFIPLFTTMFTNGQGFATGMVGQLGYWLSQHEVQRGGQPAHYYVVLMGLYEFLPVLVGLGGMVYYLLGLRRTPHVEAPDAAEPADEAPASSSTLVPLLIYWSLAALLIYSWAGEKMPWLTMHLTVPFQLLSGWALGHMLQANWREIRERGGLWLLALLPLFVYTLTRILGNKPFVSTSTADLGRTMLWITALLVAIITAVPIARIASRLRQGDAWRMVGLSVVTLLVAFTIRFAWMATFINADLASEFLVYAQGTPDTRLVTKELEDLSRRLTGGLHLKVAYDDDSSWPFVWYLRNFDNAQFYGKKPGGPFDAEVVIVGSANEAAVKPFLGNRYFRRDYRLIWWPNQDWYMNMSVPRLWNDLKDPVARRKFWDVIYNRKHEASLTAWPFVHNFSLHVRRDVAQQLWDYGPESMLGADLSLPGDDYVERWAPRAAQAAWGSPGNGPGQLRAPKGLALDAEGNLYVADSQNHRIQVFDANGGFLRQWGSQGNAPGQFNEPWGVAVGPNGDVYVADTWNHRVQVFDSQGVFKLQWGIFGEVPDAMGAGNVYYGPRDVACDADGNLYVTDTGNKRVVKYTAQGQMLMAVGGAGDLDGQMLEPVGVTVASDGTVYVVDTWNQRVQAFDASLAFMLKFPVYAWDGMSVVNKPYIAADSAGNLYITDPEGYRVLEFDPQGKLLASWGQFGSDFSSMNLPTGIVVDQMGRILVADSDNHRILVFGAN